MQKPPDLFDIDLLATRRARAARLAERADFLQEAVAREVSERLKEINRTFRAPAIIGPRADLWAAILEIEGLGRIPGFPPDDNLPLQSGAHDLVIHALGLHAMNDPVGQMVQARHALHPDGLFLGAMFGGGTLHELRAALAQAEIEIRGGLSPRIAPMGEIRDLGALLQRAGLALPVADSQRYDVHYDTPLHLMRDLRAMGETNVLRGRDRRPMRRAMLARACECYTEAFPAPGGRVRATFEVVFLTGWAPAQDQPQPMRPGSAKVRLADALGVPELRAGDKPGR